MFATMTRHARRTLLLVLLVIVCPLAAQAPNTAGTPSISIETSTATGSTATTATIPPASSAENIRNSPSRSSEEVARLETEVRLLREFHEHLLATVLWSLGVTLTIAILLVGYNWYNNVRAYERDKEAMQRELQVSLRESVATISTAVDAKVSAEIEKLTASMRADLDKLLAATAEHRKKDRDGFEAKIESVTRRVKQLELARQLTAAQEGLAEAKRDRILGNIILSAADVADVAVEMSEHALLHAVAVDALEAVRAILADPDHRVLPFTLIRGSDILERLPKNLGALRNELAEQLERLKLRKPMDL